MTTTFENARVGDRVWDFYYGWGVIESRSNGKISVDFNKTILRYDEQGKHYNGIRALFWNEIKFDAPPQPKRKVKKWIRLFKTVNGAWAFTGEDEFPTLFNSREEAAQTVNPYNYAYAEIEIEE